MRFVVARREYRVLMAERRLEVLDSAIEDVSWSNKRIQKIQQAADPIEQARRTSTFMLATMDLENGPREEDSRSDAWKPRPIRCQRDHLQRSLDCYQPLTQTPSI